MNNNTPAVVGIERASALHQYLVKINSIKSLTQEEEYFLAKKYAEEKDIKSAHQLINSHLKLVAKIALTYKNYGLSILDIIAEGNIGLVYALKKYDPERGFRVATYSMHWIKFMIQDYVLRSWSLVKIGTTSTQKKLFFQLSAAKRKFAYENGFDYKAIASELKVTENELIEIDNRLSNGDVSLNQPLSLNNTDSGVVEKIDTLHDGKSSHELIMANKQDNTIKHNILSDAMLKLTPRELDIFTNRFLSHPVSTLSCLGQKHNISPERVRQIQVEAFNKVKDYANVSLHTLETQSQLAITNI